MTAATLSRPPVTPDVPLAARIVAIVGGGLLGLGSIYALLRALVGLAPVAPGAHDVAVAIHLMSVLPAIPLGLYVLLTRKGGARHRLLGRVWMGLMVSTALSALFIRQLNHGGFSWIHIFVPVTLLAAWAAIAAARAGRIAKHRNRLIGMYIGALVIPGMFAFAPGRVMWTWAFG
ncbi:hypothetical protein ASG37_14370 [Sphingomonas sp. Leaf407]|uniref:DUF2306 domain-containing protein n=1 Tax=unclassified Sphingomonas TaxID=196159 RepID=UPI0006FDA938|nr:MULTISPECIES: DUF2306 domain-containing protein [unclassified Sphingomonas]KQN35530.1 hypothetical protein ASE97_13625 [Sphingomonas sp. Leaf42]KQT26397.1 hypothetical protein ASG37_14370 [Sphingomonas sp. Leaf407]